MPLERSTKRKASDCAAAPPPCATKCARGSESSVQEGPSATANESSQAEQVCAGIDYSFMFALVICSVLRIARHALVMIRCEKFNEYFLLKCESTVCCSAIH